MTKLTSQAKEVVSIDNCFAYYSINETSLLCFLFY